MRELQARRGYQEISTPILVDEKLWQQSGHWDLYDDNMFLVESEGQTFSLKPMNCPESTFIYRLEAALLPRPAAALQRVRPAPSQRALGHAVSGLTRVRQFIQDDAHIYVRPDQLADEIEALLGEVREAYSLGRAEAALRVRDEAGQGDRRSRALGAGRGAASRRRSTGPAASYEVKPKDGTFYAPKIDIYIDDALGPRVADGDDPGRPRRCCPSGST